MKTEIGIRISFTATEALSLHTKETGLSVTQSGSTLSVRVYYDFKETPLSLTAQVKAGDRITLLLLSYWIRLSVNGKTQDEEWPCGNCLYRLGDPILANLPFQVEQTEYQAPELPSVIGTFENAQGWKPEENVFVGDCMPYTDQNTYHVLYLKDRHHHGSKWGYGAHQWEHISTKDFVHWQIHPMAVKITDPMEGSICTGSWIAKEATQYLFYTVRTPNQPAPIRRSVSKDGYHYEKDPNFSCTVSEKYERTSLRDPKVVKGEDGLYHMFLTTSLVTENRGCLAHLTSSDLDHWKEEAEPIYLSPDESQPECPDYIQYNGYYYLIFSHHGVGQYLYAKHPFSDWQAPADPTIPCKTVPKGAVWEGKIVFTGFDPTGNGYAGTLTFRTATAKENGELVFDPKEEA